MPRKLKNRGRISYAHEALDRHNIMFLNLGKMVFESDRESVDNCKMDRRVFVRLCHLLKRRKIEVNRNMSVEEIVISKIW